MSNYENHQLNYTKRGQELESKKRAFLTLIILSCVAFAGWQFYKNYIKEIASRTQNQDVFVATQKQSNKPQNSRFFRNTQQTRNHVDDTPMEVPLPESVEQSVEKPVRLAEKASKPSIDDQNHMDEKDKKSSVSSKEADKATSSDIEKEKLAFIGQQRPKELIKAPFYLNGTLILPINLSWIDFIIRPALPIFGTLISEASSETEENYVFRDYYYLKMNNKSEPRFSKVKCATVKQSLDGKSVELYEYSDSDVNNRKLCWSIKAEEGATFFTDAKSNDVYKVTLSDGRYLVTYNDGSDFAEVVCDEKFVRASSLVFTNKSISAPYKIGVGKEKQLYFSIATMLFDINNLHSKLALYLESLRIEELLTTAQSKE